MTASSQSKKSSGSSMMLTLALTLQALPGSPPRPQIDWTRAQRLMRGFGDVSSHPTTPSVPAADAVVAADGPDTAAEEPAAAATAAAPDRQEPQVAAPGPWGCPEGEVDRGPMLAAIEAHPPAEFRDLSRRVRQRTRGRAKAAAEQEQLKQRRAAEEMAADAADHGLQMAINMAIAGDPEPYGTTSGSLTPLVEIADMDRPRSAASSSAAAPPTAGSAASASSPPVMTAKGQEIAKALAAAALPPPASGQCSKK